MHGADASKDRGSAKYDRGDGEKFVARPGVRLGLSHPRHVDQCGQCREDARQDVNEGNAPIDRNARIASSVGRETDRTKRASKGRPMDQQPDADGRQDQNRQLSWNHAKEISLAEKKE
jgi:hypothetical protein